jgi:hemoglobin
VRSLYEHAGGEEAPHRLEEIFYSKALADPVLKTPFTERRPTHVDHLTGSLQSRWVGLTASLANLAFSTSAMCIDT